MNSLGTNAESCSSAALFGRKLVRMLTQREIEYRGLDPLVVERHEELEGLVPLGVRWATDLAAAHIVLARIDTELPEQITTARLTLELCELTRDLSLAAAEKWAEQLQAASRIRQVVALTELLIAATHEI